MSVLLADGWRVKKVMLEAFWHLLAINVVPLFAAIYLATTVCLIVLAIHVHFLGKRFAEVARNTREHADLIAKLADLSDKLDEAAGATTVAADTHTVPVPNLALRDALEAIVAEMTSDGAPEPADPQPAAFETRSIREYEAPALSTESTPTDPFLNAREEALVDPS